MSLKPHKKLDLYYYGEVGRYDADSPSYVAQMPYAKEVLYLIASHEKYRLNIVSLSEKLCVATSDLQETVDELKRVNLISEKEGCYTLECVSFINEDILRIQSAVSEGAKQIVSKLKAKQDTLFQDIEHLKHFKSHNRKRWLYHLVCDAIFDGTAFDYFEQKQVFQTSKEQVGNRNYIVYGFENSLEMNALSQKLLCSSNNYSVDRFTFNSFGDSDGQRADFFRVFRKALAGVSTAINNESVSKVYIDWLDSQHAALGKRCGEMLEKVVLYEGVAVSDLNDSELEAVAFLERFEYIERQNDTLKCLVPVFVELDDLIVQAVSDRLMDEIFPDVLETFETLYQTQLPLSFITHDIARGEVLIELWHQLFGQINEALVREGLVSTPEFRANEGRYLRSFYIKHER